MKAGAVVGVGVVDILVIVAYRSRGADIEGALGGINLLRGFGLFKKIHVGLVFIIAEQLGGLFEANVARGATIVNIPLAGDAFLENAGLVSHRFTKIHTSASGATLERG